MTIRKDYVRIANMNERKNLMIQEIEKCIAKFNPELADKLESKDDGVYIGKNPMFTISLSIKDYNISYIANTDYDQWSENETKNKYDIFEIVSKQTNEIIINH